MMKYDLKQIYDWPLIVRIFIIAMVCLLELYLGYFFDFSNLNLKIKMAQQHEEDLKVQLMSLKDKEKLINNDLSKYSILENELNQIKKKLITPAELPELINEILKIGTQNNLQIINFTPKTEEKEEHNYIKVNITAVMTGTYDQIANFISQVANMNHIVAINDFVISKTNLDKTSAEQAALGNRLTTNMTLLVYEMKAS